MQVKGGQSEAKGYTKSGGEKAKGGEEMNNRKVVSLELKLPHTVAEVMCVECKKRWIDAFPSDVWLKDLECPYCGNFGMIIATGQELEAAKK